MTLRQQTKADRVLDLFPKVGIEILLDKVLEETGIKNYDSLKAMFSYIRKAEHAPAESKMDIRIYKGICRRMKWKRNISYETISLGSI